LKRDSAELVDRQRPIRAYLTPSERASLLDIAKSLGLTASSAARTAIQEWVRGQG
jgi:predicted ArsR family transcriptional regulator